MRRLRRGVPVAVGLSLLVLAAIVAYASSRRDEDVLRVLAGLPWWTLPLALLCHVAAHMMWGARMSVLSIALRRPMAPHNAWATVTAGTFGGAVTPGRLGGEALKVALLMRRGMSGAHASRLLLVDRAFDLVFFVCLGAVAAILLPRHLGAEGAAVQVTAAAATAFLVLFVALLGAALVSPRATTRAIGPMIRLAARIGKRDPQSLSIRAIGFVEQLRDGVVLVARRRPGAAALAAVLTVGNWAIEYAAVWTILAGFGHVLPYHLVFAAAAVVTIVSNAPVTPGGSGVAEAAALAMLGPLAAGISLLFVVVWRGVTYYYDLAVGGVLAAWLMSRRGSWVREDPVEPLAAGARAGSQGGEAHVRQDASRHDSPRQGVPVTQDATAGDPAPREGGPRWLRS